MRHGALKRSNTLTARPVHKVGALLLAIAGAYCGTASAADDAPRENTFEVTPFVGFLAGGGFEDPTTGSDRDVEDDTNFGIFLNLVTDVPDRYYELFYTKQSSEVEGTTPIDLDIQYLQIGGTVGFKQERYLIPYFGMTVGVTQMSPDVPGLDDETKFSVSVGGGIRFPITDHFGIRFDTRAFVTFLENDSEIFCVSDGGATCLIRPKSDTFLQYTGSLGVTFAF